MPDPETLREQCLSHFRKAVANPDRLRKMTTDKFELRA